MQSVINLYFFTSLNQKNLFISFSFHDSKNKDTCEKVNFIQNSNTIFPDKKKIKMPSTMAVNETHFFTGPGGCDQSSANPNIAMILH